MMIIVVIIPFTYIWVIRIYANGRRNDFPIKMRNRIAKHLNGGFIPPLSTKTDGGFARWYKDWPLWSYRGICFAIGLYCFVFILGVGYKMGEPLFGIYIETSEGKKVEQELRNAFEARGYGEPLKEDGAVFDEIADGKNVYVVKIADKTAKVYRKIHWAGRAGYCFIGVISSAALLALFSCADWKMIALKKERPLVYASSEPLKKGAEGGAVQKSLKCAIRCNGWCVPEGATIKWVSTMKLLFKCWVITDKDGNQLYFVRRRITCRTQYSVWQL